MEKANENFNKLEKCLQGDVMGNKEELLEAYQLSRKEVSQQIFLQEQSKWNKVIGDGSKKLWEKLTGRAILIHRQLNSRYLKT